MRKLTHWHSFYDRLYLPPERYRAACRLPTGTDIVTPLIVEVNCERCLLRFQFEMENSIGKMKNTLRRHAGRGKA